MEMSVERIDAMVSSCYSTQLKWLDCLLLQKWLQRISSDKVINVTGFNVAPATKKGENFASDIYRVKVHFSEHKSNCIDGVSSTHEFANVIVRHTCVHFRHRNFS